MNEPADKDALPRHPPAYALEAVAAGDAVPAVAAHLEACAPCRDHVRVLREDAARFRARQGAEDFVARVRATEAHRARARRGASVVRIGAVVGPLLAAALVLLVLRGRGRDGERGPGALPVAVSSGVPPVAATTESRFKGGLVVAVVRERDGRQERLAGPFDVRAGDRVRVEVSTDHEGPVSAGLLTDEGQWVLLLAPAVLEAGTHYSELDARFDATPTRATLLAGEPAAVAQARATRDFSSVVAWRVTSEAAP